MYNMSFLEYIIPGAALQAAGVQHENGVTGVVQGDPNELYIHAYNVYMYTSNGIRYFVYRSVTYNQ